MERPLRLATGLILLAYALTHFLNHAFGIKSLATMEAATTVFLAPWQTPPGLVLLYGSFLTHGGLGLWALYRRRHLRIPAWEAWQLGLGLTIPLLLIPHAAGVRIGALAYGLENSYERLIYLYWIESPEFALPRQLLLLVVIWLHGCIGLRGWLRLKPWYRSWSPALASVATLIPALALAGVASAGWEIEVLIRRDPDLMNRLSAPRPGGAALAGIVDRLEVGYVLLVAGIFALRELRRWHARHFRAVKITYPRGRIVTVPRGFSILEASRWARISHRSVCGGRGRCSTCRVRVVAGAEALGRPGAVEQATLARIAAPPDVRLACQVRPSADIEIVPLVGAAARPELPAARFGAAVEGGRELTIAAMFVDLRDSTRLAAGRLPFDALFLVDHYVQAVTGPIRANGGHVTSIAGDGVMSIFGLDGDPAVGARTALIAALQLWRAIEAMNRDFAEDLGSPLRFGIGIHVGLAVVGLLGADQDRSLQFLGDTGNVAAKLEAQTKRLDCTLIASTAATDLVNVPRSAIVVTTAEAQGRTEPVEVAVFRNAAELEFVLGAAGAL